MTRRPRLLGLQRALLVALWIASLGSVLGALALIHTPQVVSVFGRALAWFIKVPTLVYLTAIPALVWLLSREELSRGRATALLAWGAGVGLAAELLGTTTGLPFGAYHYTDFLGPKILGHVPAFVPLSWFAMAVLALGLAARVTDRRGVQIVFAAGAMVGWDLALDPAMVAGWPVWVWTDPAGVYYGMPVLNLVGWWVTSALIAGGIQVLTPVPPVTGRRAEHLWLASAVLPLGLILVQGLWPAAVLGSIGVGLPVLLSRRAKGRVGAKHGPPERGRLPASTSSPRAVAARS